LKIDSLDIFLLLDGERESVIGPARGTRPSTHIQRLLFGLRRVVDQAMVPRARVVIAMAVAISRHRSFRAAGPAPYPGPQQFLFRSG
jgi:hypothetical protein